MLHGLKTGSEVLKQINKEMNLEDVEKLMEETHEARAYQEVGRGTLGTNRKFKIVCRKSAICSPTILLLTKKRRSRRSLENFRL